MFNPLDYVRKEPYKMYINGEFVESKSGKTFEIVNPANNNVFATAYKGGLEDVNEAIKAARKAFDEGLWREMSNFQRSKLLLKARDILQTRIDEFACIETLECGKLFPSVKYYEVPNSIDGFEFSAGKARNLDGKVVPVDGGGKNLNYVIWQPHGVVGEILPWNGPLMMGCQKISSILAAGNTVVVKPSSWASLSMLLLAEVFHEAGFPKGVVNVVTGSGAEVGNALVESCDVDMVSMTGGTETGRKLLKASSETIKTLALELGGKSPNIVFDDVDVDNVVKWATFAFTLNSGQVCVSGTRLLLHENIYDEFLAKMKELCESFKAGNGFDFEKGVNFSSLISREHYNDVWKYIDLGIEEGAKLITGGYKYEDEELKKGNFVPPTIFAGVTPEMRIFQEEIFGPVLCVTKFKTEAEAIKIGNSVKFGLAGAVFTNNIKRAHRVAEKIKGGQIYVNTYFSKGMMESPGTGWKESGIGEAGIHKYMHPKTIFVNLDEENNPPI